VPLIFAALIVLAILGVFLVVIVDMIEARTTKWARRSQMSNA
jgi:NitT/TauT family transport system permease protein